MPDPALSQAIREAYAAAPSEVVILHTLEIRHPGFIEPIRVVRNFPDRQSWIALGGAAIQAVLDAMAPEDREMVGLVARLEGSAPADAGQLVPFIALAFDLELPPVENVPVPEAVLTIDNVGREITDALEAAATSQHRIEVTYRPYLSTDIEGPQMDPPLTLTLSDARASPLKVTGRVRMLDFGNKAFPSAVYTAKTFPGLAR
jgi:hypothetical protein